MIPFYISIIFFGIFLIVFTIGWILLDKKKSIDHTNNLEDRKNELIKIIADADQMISELNRFSDYVVSQVDKKSEEVTETMKSLEDKLIQIKAAAQEVEINELHQTEKILQSNTSEVRNSQVTTPELSFQDEIKFDNLILKNESQDYKNNISIQVSSDEKVALSNLKHKEVMQLADMGLSETEIAKRLKVGRGEIQLIIGMNR